MKQTISIQMYRAILRTLEVWEHNKWVEYDCPDYHTVGSYAEWLLTYEDSYIYKNLNDYKAIRLNGQYIIRREKEAV